MRHFICFLFTFSCFYLSAQIPALFQPAGFTSWGANAQLGGMGEISSLSPQGAIAHSFWQNPATLLSDEIKLKLQASRYPVFHAYGFDNENLHVVDVSGQINKKLALGLGYRHFSFGSWNGLDIYAQPKPNPEFQIKGALGYRMSDYLSIGLGLGYTRSAMIIDFLPAEELIPFRSLHLDLGFMYAKNTEIKSWKLHRKLAFSLSNMGNKGGYVKDEPQALFFPAQLMAAGLVGLKKENPKATWNLSLAGEIGKFLVPSEPQHQARSALGGMFWSLFETPDGDLGAEWAEWTKRIGFEVNCRWQYWQLACRAGLVQEYDWPLCGTWGVGIGGFLTDKDMIQLDYSYREGFKRRIYPLAQRLSFSYIKLIE